MSADERANETRPHSSFPGAGSPPGAPGDRRSAPLFELPASVRGIAAGRDPAVPPSGRRRSPWRDLVPFSRRHRRFFVGGFASAILFIATRLAFPFPLKAIVEHSASPAGQAPPSPVYVPSWGGPVVWLAAAFVALALLGGLAEHLQRLSFARFVSRTINDVRAVATVHIAEPAFRDRPPGDLVARVVADSFRVKQGLKGALNYLLRDGLLSVGICGALAALDFRLGVAQLAGGAVAVGIAIWGKARVADAAALHREGEGLLAEAVYRAVISEADDSEVVCELDAGSGQADVEVTRWEGRTTFSGHVVLAATAGVALVLGLQDYDAGGLSSGGLFAVVAYLLMVQGPIVRLARQVTRLGPIVVSADRLALLAHPAARGLLGAERGEDLG